MKRLTYIQKLNSLLFKLMDPTKVTSMILSIALLYRFEKAIVLFKCITVFPTEQIELGVLDDYTGKSGFISIKAPAYE